MVKALHLGVLVRVGASFINGKLVERPNRLTRKPPERS
jgi:hypothetical protein